MQRPWVLALAAGVIVLMVAFAMPLLRMVDGSSVSGPPPAGLPWHVTLLPTGHAQVFGLVAGRDTLADVELRFGDILQVALVARLGEAGALEALVEPFAAGFVAGRLVLAFEARPDQLAQWRDRSGTSQPMDGGARRFPLREADRVEARRARLVGLSFLPTVRLSEDDVRQRFGAPAEVLRQTDGALVLLYPDQGLSIAVAEGRRSVLQYVAPVEFAQRLRAPLIAAAAAPVTAR